MKTSKKIREQFPFYGYLILPIWLLGMTSPYAQEAVLAAGGDVVVTNEGSVSYSVGQIAYNTSSDIFCNSVAEGVQQPDTISTTVGSVSTSTTLCIVGIEENNGISHELQAYPNPTTDMLILTLENPIAARISYQLHDMNGKLLSEGNVTDRSTGISMLQLAPATYLLTVLQNEIKTKTFQIIKN